MHGVERSPEPGFFDAIRCRYDRWDELYGVAGALVRDCRNRRPTPCCTAYLRGLDGEGIRQEIRNALRADFSGVCGYCEQDCADIVTAIEHFRPRLRFPGEWITWLNLVYACQRCDERKEDKWPGAPGDPDRSFSYVNPSLTPDQQQAEEFFEYYIETGDAASHVDDAGDMVPGQVMPSSNLSSSDWWRADRTILDLDLNSDYDQVDARLPDLRTDQLDFVLDEIGDLTADVTRTSAVLQQYSQPDQPFSSYVAAFARSLGVQVR